MLFDLENDIGEQQNLAEKNPKQAKKLAKRLTEFLKANGATRPIRKATGTPCSWPDGSD